MGFVTGICLCFAVFTPMFLMQKSAADKLLAASIGNRAALASCTANLEGMNSRWTLIMDAPGAAPALQVLHGLVAIAPGEALTGPKGVSARWEIPAKVVPFISGPMDGAAYYYWDPQTRELDGPHVPRQSSAQANP
jgi:hypothetical protein